MTTISLDRRSLLITPSVCAICDSLLVNYIAQYQLSSVDLTLLIESTRDNNVYHQTRILSSSSILLPIHDSEAPASVGATHTPRSVLILCTLFVAGSTHAASRLSSVVKPLHERFEIRSYR